MIAQPICQICGDTIAAKDIVYCQKCMTPHHVDCWAYTNVCSTFACGCANAGVIRKNGIFVENKQISNRAFVKYNSKVKLSKIKKDKHLTMPSISDQQITKTPFGLKVTTRKIKLFTVFSGLILLHKHIIDFILYAIFEPPVVFSVEESSLLLFGTILIIIIIVLIIGSIILRKLQKEKLPLEKQNKTMPEELKLQLIAARKWKHKNYRKTKRRQIGFKRKPITFESKLNLAKHWKRKDQKKRLQNINN